MTAIIEDGQEIKIEKWGSLNTAASPQRLPEGQSPNNQNVWMDEKPGSIVTANGYSKLGTTPSGNPTTFLINFFKTSDGSQTLVLSDGSTIWKTTNYVDYTSIKTGLSGYFQIRGLVIRDKLWLTNGSDPVMTYDGTTLAVLDGTGGTPNVPIAKYISYHDERVWMYGISGEPSSLIFSDLTDSGGTIIAPDSSGAWPVDNELQISEGDADIGTGIFVYRGYLYVSKSFSIWRIAGYDEYTYTKIKTRSSTGTRFAESIQEMDNLVHFIGVDGLYTFDGETSVRISDIIDPANPEPGVFAFRNLQQPLLNNKFWNLSNTTDWNLGTVPRNITTTSDRLTLIPDNTKAQFDAGSLLSNIDTAELPGYIQLARASSGGSADQVGVGVNAYLDDSNNGVGVYGDPKWLSDGVLTAYTGFGVRSGFPTIAWVVDLSSDKSTHYDIGQIFVVGWQNDTAFSASVQVNTGTYQTKYGTQGTWVTVGTITNQGLGFNPVNLTFDFATKNAIQVRIVGGANAGSYLCAEIAVYKTAYIVSGKFISQTIDFGATPASFGTFYAAVNPHGETYRFFTISSADGVTWDAEVTVTAGSAIGSTLKRYLRWGAYLWSATGQASPNITDAFVGSSYLSEIFNTGGSIFLWGAYQIALNKYGQTISSYYRAAATSGGVLAASWIPIIGGAVPNTAITNSYIQLRIEMSTTDHTFRPYVSGTTVNWILSNGAGINTLQNVASFVWLNRYWLSAATIGADANDIIIVRGKSTYQSPYHTKDFSMLSFCRFQDYFIAGSSIDGSIYRMEYGYSKDGAAMDSFFETQDYDRSGMLLKLLEIIVNTDRSGPYSLSVGISTDGGITYTDKTIDLTRTSSTQNLGFSKKLIIGSFMADKFRVRFRINAADQPFTVDNAIVYYRLSPIRGSLN